MNDAFTKMVQAGDYTKLVADALREAVTGNEARKLDTEKLANDIINFLGKWNDNFICGRDALKAKLDEWLSSALQAHGERVGQQWRKAVEAHIKDWPNLGDCEWNCLTAEPLKRFAERVKRETLEEAAQRVDGIIKATPKAIAAAIRALA